MTALLSPFVSGNSAAVPPLVLVDGQEHPAGPPSPIAAGRPLQIEAVVAW